MHGQKSFFYLFFYKCKHKTHQDCTSGTLQDCDSRIVSRAGHLTLCIRIQEPSTPANHTRHSSYLLLTGPSAPLGSRVVRSGCQAVCETSRMRRRLRRMEMLRSAQRISARPCFHPGVTGARPAAAAGRYDTLACVP